MASIQILEISPVEAQIEELSENTTGSVRGGFDLSEPEFWACLADATYSFFSGATSLSESVALFMDCLGIQANDGNGAVEA